MKQRYLSGFLAFYMAFMLTPVPALAANLSAENAMPALNENTVISNVEATKQEDRDTALRGEEETGDGTEPVVDDIPPDKAEESAASEKKSSAVSGADTLTYDLGGGGYLIFHPDSGTVTKCTLGDITDVVIPDHIEGTPVTAVGENAFRDCSSLTSAAIPDGVTSIGDYAFLRCSALKEVNIPETVKSIGYQAFHSCSKLKEIRLPSSVTSIGQDLFMYCTSLTSAVIDANIPTIRRDMFHGCSKLSSVRLSDSVTSIAQGAFTNCANLSAIDLPDGLKTIGESAFSGCSSLNEIELPDGLKTIGRSAFLRCSGLTVLEIPDSVTSIEDYAFQGCGGLFRIRFPDGLTSLPFGVLQDCSTLTEVVFPSALQTLENQVFSDCASLRTVDLPEGLRTIGYRAFSGCANLREIVIPSSVTSLDSSGYHFSGCTSLAMVTILGPIKSIGKNAFQSCKSLQWLSLPDTLTSINSSAFQNAKTDFTLYCKAGTSAADYVTGKSYRYELIDSDTRTLDISVLDLAGVPSTDFTVTWYNADGDIVGEGRTLSDAAMDAFYSYEIALGAGLAETCAAPARGRIAPYGSGSRTILLKQAGYVTDGVCGSGLTWELLEDGRLFIRGTGAMADYASKAAPWKYYSDRIQTVVVGEGVTSIGTSAFFAYSNLKRVELPDSLTRIGMVAFGGTGLTGVTLPGGIETVADMSFFRCADLETVNFEPGASGVKTTIGPQAFAYCGELKQAVLPYSVTDISSNAFEQAHEDFVIFCYRNSEAERYAQENSIPYQYPDRTLTVTVLAPDGAELTTGFEVVWFDEAGVQLPVTGSVLHGADLGKSYSFEITLGADLSALYESPSRQTILAEQSEAVTVMLTAKRQITLAGKVVDQSQLPVQGASISICRMDEDTEIQTVTDENGEFRTEVPATVVQLTIRKAGYYTQSVTLDLSDQTGQYTMEAPCVLAAVAADRISLTIWKQQAGENLAEAAKSRLFSAEGLLFSLTGADGRSITGFEVQGLALIFQPGAVNANERITLTVTDPGGGYLPDRAEVVLGEDRTGAAALCLLQKGGVVLGVLSGPDAQLLLFDSSGACVRAEATHARAVTGGLDAGRYQLVLMQKNDFLRGAPNQAYLTALGLVPGTDYLSLSVDIADGTLTRVADCQVPWLREDLFSALVSENSSVTISKPSGVSVGTLFQIRVAYELDSQKDVSPKALRVTLPRGLSLPAFDILMDQKTVPYTYDPASGVLTISAVGRKNAVAWLYCMANEAGTHTISADLALGAGTQLIGTAAIQADDARLKVPERTGQMEDIIASGTAVPGSAVELFDNGTPVGATTANGVGSWNLRFDLAGKPYQYSYHMLHARLTPPKAVASLQTEDTLMVYKNQKVQLKTITMYNLGDTQGKVVSQATVLDFTSTSTEKPHFFMWPSRYPEFTFKVEFEGDASELTEVYVVTENSAKEKTYVKTVYDPATKAWIGTHNYTSFQDAPVSIGAVYSLPQDSWLIPEDPLRMLDVEASLGESFERMEEKIKPVFDAALRYQNITYRPDGVSADIYASGSGQKLGSYTMESSIIDPAVTKDTLAAEGYQQLDSAGNQWGKTEFQETSVSQSLVDLEHDFDYQMDLDLDVRGIDYQDIREQWNAEVKNLWKTVSDTIIEIGQTASYVYAFSEFLGGPGAGPAGAMLDVWELERTQSDWMDLLNNNMSCLNQNLDALKDTAKQCSEGQVMDSLQWQIEVIESLMMQYETTSEKIINDTAFYLGLNSMMLYTVQILSGPMGPELSFMVSTAQQTIRQSEKNVASPIEKELEEKYNDILGEMTKLQNMMSNTFPNCDEAKRPLPFTREHRAGKGADYIVDPSGYVYEAVPSNRLEGVVAVIFSDADSSPWDAGHYDQKNPQLTGAGGGYYWDVPAGKWKVTFTKQGYQPADSSKVLQADADGWLPVPPPQLGINVGMVSTAAPTVQQAAAYADQAEIAFSQYMDIQSVKNAVSMLCDGIEAAGLTVTALDAEYNLEGTMQYASRFAVRSSDGDFSGKIRVLVDGSVRNYAGTLMGTDYSSPDLPISVRPSGITGPDSAVVRQQASAEISLALQPAVPNQKLVAESLSDALVRVDTAELITDGEGKAVLTISGGLPGAGLIRVIEPVTGLEKTIAVQIKPADAEPSGKPAKVTASLEGGTLLSSGMAIPAGSKIVLQTQTAGAVIRYTLDDTCPCQDSALFYHTPMILTKDTVLRAAAYQDGEYSDTIRLELRIKSSGSDDGQEEAPRRAKRMNTVQTNRFEVAVSSTVGGMVTADRKSAAKGDLVTLTVKPDTGYTLASLNVSDADGNEIGWKEEGGSRYTFAMPKGRAEVAAVFRRVQESPWNNPFADISEDQWHYGAVQYVSENHLMNGVSDTRFAPGANFSRAMAAQIFYNMAGRPAVSGNNRFPDVAAGEWYTDAVLWAAEAEVISGYSNGGFGTNDPITREQLAVMFHHYVRAKGGMADVSDSLSHFSDSAAVSGWAETSVRWAVGVGLLSGKAQQRLDPAATATRAEVAQILMHFQKNVAE